MKHIVNFSGGICSFWSAHRVIEKYGKEDVTILFADVLMEDDDLYRFNRDAEAFLGMPITRISKEMTPWDLFATEGVIGNSRIDVCSRILKREFLDEWTSKNCLEMDTTIYLGMDWTEEHRLEGAKKRMAPWRVEAPMQWEPAWDKCKMVSELDKIGIAIPRLYKMGFPHNNCGGFCVKAGQAQFAHLHKVMPERYAYHEEQERKLRETVGDYSVMKDRRGDGKAKPLTMETLRKRIEAGESFDRSDWGGCGCAIGDTE